MLSSGPNMGFNSQTWRLELQLKPRCGCPTDWATPLLYYFLIVLKFCFFPFRSLMHLEFIFVMVKRKDLILFSLIWKPSSSHNSIWIVHPFPTDMRCHLWKMPNLLHVWSCSGISIMFVLLIYCHTNTIDSLQVLISGKSSCSACSYFPGLSWFGSLVFRMNTRIILRGSTLKYCSI